MSSIFDQGSGLNSFLNSGVGIKLTNVFSDVASNLVGGLVKTKKETTTANGQVIPPAVINQNNPNAGGLLNSLGFGTGGSPNYILIGLIVGIIALVIFLIVKK